MKGFVEDLIEVTPRGGVTQHLTCIEMDGEGEVWAEAIVTDHLPLDVHLYLRELVGGPRRFPLELDEVRPP